MIDSAPEDVRRFRTFKRSVVDGLLQDSKSSIASIICDKHLVERGSSRKRGKWSFLTTSGKLNEKTWKSLVKTLYPNASSCRIHPTAQMSTLLLNLASSVSSSGARYPDVPLEYRVVL